MFNTFCSVSKEALLGLVTLIMESGPRHRNVDKLPKSIPRDVTERLQGFIGLHTTEDIASWHEFCENSPYTEVKSA